MAINLKLSHVRSADAKIEPWGRSWLGWDETLTDDELWEQNRGVWVLSVAKVQAQRFATLSYAGRRQVVVELTGHELVHDPRKGKSYVALVGDVLRPGDPVRDALVGQPDSPVRNSVSYYDTGHLDSMSTSERAQRPTSTGAAFLLTNNPERWTPRTGVWQKWVSATQRGRSVKESWSVGNRTRGIEPGDRVFLLLQGHDPRGLIGSGYATSTVFQDRHFDPDRGNEITHYILIEWDHLLEHGDALPTVDLAARFPEQHWDTQMSGIAVKSSVLADLESTWAKHVGVPATATPPPVGGQGWQPDAVKRKKTEDAAQERLMKHYGKLGWIVRDTRIGHPYDATATKNGQVTYLEAKGTISTGASVSVTRGEVDHARKNPGACVMGVLSDVAFLPNGEVDPKSGTFRLLRWDPDAGELVTESYSWKPGGSTALA
ncbi:protein NO VEIN domain-containing protein [Segeticoccus rhizosphaerae]|uniref:protein NO VEIN domain-containing protein n=1 Tax=Segeticoccus rhizosphaerae TaxID=1104777 RepID=UPI0010BFD9A6|nr:DUF3883 domain-containing protein [Ornithinicoccus soli]